MEYRMKQEQKTEQPQQQQQKSLFSIPINGCLSVIIMAALACIAVKGCKMVNMKYEEQKAQHEIYMDSINKTRSDTTYYFNQRQK